ncbi:MAG TPA: MFS transporter [Steroidobacteraceae bacterium]
MTQVLRIEALVDGRRFDRFNFNLLIWSFLAMLGDGYDIAALASAAPQLARSWHVATSAFAPALSASLFGILLGAPSLGYAGDRFGRRSAIIAGCAIYGVATLSTVLASGLGQLVPLRFVAGVGIGGLMPNTIALNAELAPRRLRGGLIVLMFTGITAGGAIPGFVQAWLIPAHGWQIMFWIGGLVPLVVATCLRFALPESVKYLVRRPQRRAQLLATVRRLRPDLAVAEDAQFQFEPAPPAHGSGLAQIFGDGLTWITALLWFCFASALMANYFLTSWLPLIFENHGYTPRQSGIAITCYHYGGTLGGLIVAVVLGRFGFGAVAALFLLAIPAIAAIGLSGVSFVSVTVAVLLAGLCTLGAQFGNNAASGLLYPTVFRSRGVGWALGAGRLGSVAGPLVGGLLVGMQLPLQRLFLLAAVPMAAGLIAAVSLAALCHRRFAGARLDDVPAVAGERESARGEPA